MFNLKINQVGINNVELINKINQRYMYCIYLFDELYFNKITIT